jgi:hypothetical protein
MNDEHTRSLWRKLQARGFCAVCEPVVELYGVRVLVCRVARARRASAWTRTRDADDMRCAHVRSDVTRRALEFRVGSFGCGRGSMCVAVWVLTRTHTRREFSLTLRTAGAHTAASFACESEYVFRFVVFDFTCYFPQILHFLTSVASTQKQNTSTIVKIDNHACSRQFSL